MGEPRGKRLERIFAKPLRLERPSGSAVSLTVAWGLPRPAVMDERARALSATRPICRCMEAQVMAIGGKADTG